MHPNIHSNIIYSCQDIEATYLTSQVVLVVKNPLANAET